MVKGMSEAQIERYVGPVARAILAEAAACEERSREAELAMYVAADDHEKWWLAEVATAHALASNALRSAWCGWVADGRDALYSLRWAWSQNARTAVAFPLALRGLTERLATEQAAEARRVAERGAPGNFDPATGLGEP